MAGARVFAKSEGNRLALSVAINLDTIDDQGDLYVVTHNGRGEALAAMETQQLIAAGFAPGYGAFQSASWWTASS